ncbi:MAG TPA: helix-turn-helix domain-containing protein [Phycisphaerae bacterium]|nr:helix-turn-helix domain-containing protein [Phycisphaerae bacterium]HRW54033.1 helix-turn-helix domain-containing protein [Phycisphaerae bacterium]
MSRQKTDADPIIMSAVEVARMLRISRRKVQLMAQAGEIPHRRIGKLLRFHRESVENWLKNVTDE